MHGYVVYDEFLSDVSGFLTGYYLVLAVLNGTMALWLLATGRQERLASWGPLRVTTGTIWAAVATGYAALTAVAWSGRPEWVAWLAIPQPIRDAVDWASGPFLFLFGVTCLLLLGYRARRFLVRPNVAWTTLNLVLLWGGLSLTDPDFVAIVGKPDNVPIVGMILLLGYFTWLATARAVRNDARLRTGRMTREAEGAERVLVWPDLVYIELICMVILTAGLIVWSLALSAPLEGPASVMDTPNPSKAPWYFLGLQELLVYFDPWMAGVVLPSLVILGLLAIPYLDRNAEGNGCYTIEQRKFAYLTFQFGFLVLWISLIVIGTFMRGPNWSFFGIYETWDAHKTRVLTNESLTQYFWVELLGVPVPAAPGGAAFASRWGWILWRELPGLLLLAGYFLVTPLVVPRLSRRVRTLRQTLGTARYWILAALVLLMIAVPLKMIGRWAFNLQYVVSIPELLLSF